MSSITVFPLPLPLPVERRGDEPTSVAMPPRVITQQHCLPQPPSPQQGSSTSVLRPLLALALLCMQLMWMRHMTSSTPAQGGLGGLLFDSGQYWYTRSGSTIVDYAIRANSINDTEIGSVTEGVFIQLGKIYPVIFDSPLNFQPSLIFLGASVTITCGPPPPGLSFVTNWTAEWTLNGISIPKDSEHNQLPVDKGVANLTVKHVFSVDKGLYQCLLTDSSKVFHGIIRQKFNITLQKKPLIQVTPIKKLVKCEVNVTVTCSVNSPYQVEFIGLPAKGTNITNTFSISSNLQNYTITCRVINHTEYSSNITLVLLKENFTCPNDPVFGNGTVDYTAEAPCEPNYVGAKTAVCKNNEWDDRQDNCILQVVQELLELSQVTLFSRSGPNSVGALGEI
ncbi:uncharacterized protein LOC123963780 [Micropterus dolomieu]|uniref:uncharacterized protein LOC123963780 n=1 Tax=Micropterus dolomieu TaxID=147949 RepID=UPI001E8EE208|nr:uncharacterized protein LOC123963780 [Micropterus dolomieu]